MTLLINDESELVSVSPLSVSSLSVNLSSNLSLNYFFAMFRVMSNGGHIRISTLEIDPLQVQTVHQYLTLSGFTDISILDDSVLGAHKPSLTGTLDHLMNNTIHQNELIDNDDFNKPTFDCGTGGKVRTACKDCSCGLAEQIESERSTTKLTLSMLENPGVGSSCGSCSLGDAFRCPGCPYRGLPAFTPGEKITLDDDFMMDL